MDLFRSSMTPGAAEAIANVLTPDENGRVYCGEGPITAKFEQEFQYLAGTPNKILGVNSCTAAIDLALHMIGVGIGDEVIVTPMTCLWAQSRVQLSDGSTKTISQIVNQKLELDVLSLNTITNNVESKRITDWIKLPADNVEWYRISTEKSRNTKGTLGTRGIRLTGDHKVYTTRGWVRVDELDVDDCIATKYPALNSRQLEVIEGTLLGDGHLSAPTRGNKGFSRFSVAHSTNQEALLSLKQQSLSGLPIRKWSRSAYKQTGPTIGIESVKTPQLKELRNKWYSHRGRKIIPSDLELTPIKLAIWYMDDGSYTEDQNIVLCTDGFDNNSVWTIFWKLVDIGFHPRVRNHRDIGERISILRSEQDRFFGLVAPYIPEQLRYKLPDSSPAYDHTLWDLGNAETFFDRVYVQKVSPNQDKRYVYCLEVADNHNFVVSDMIVSNCSASNGPVVNRGASLVWADVDPITGLINPESVERLISPWTKAIIAVDWAGRTADYRGLRNALLARQRVIPIIEDAAHKLYLDEYYGDYVAWSFGPIKHLSCGGYGGALMPPEREYDRGRLLKWHGLDRLSKADFRCEQDIEEVGYRYHMTDDMASVGLANFDLAEAGVKCALANAAYYYRELKDVSGVVVPPFNANCAYWLFGILVDNRDEFMLKMQERGIPTSRAHRRNDEHSGYKRASVHQDGNLVGTTYFDNHQVNIPVGWWITPEERQFIAESVKECCRATITV